MYWVLASVALSVLFYFYLIKPLRYWTQKGVPQKSVLSQWIRIISLVVQPKPQPEINCMIYNEFPEKRFSGAYHNLSPILYFRDPELIKQIAVKDFDHFTDHKQRIPVQGLEPLWENSLIFLKGERWRYIRSTISPSFTSSKMKAVFILINECAQNFVDHFKDKKAAHIVDMKDASTRFANDVIASTAFGIICNSFRDRNNEFYEMGNEATSMPGLLNKLRVIALMYAPNLCKFLGIQVFSPKVRKFFKELVKTNIELREKNGIVRPDMIHQLMEAKNGKVKYEDHNSELDAGFATVEESSVGRQQARAKQLSDDELTAQAVSFFFAGFKSVSTLICFLSYELAINPDIQETLRKEIDKSLENCKDTLTYENLLTIKYMDMIVSEALRKWPTLVGVDRLCVIPYTIEPAKGEPPIHIEKGELLWLPIYEIHRDPRFFPNPEQFDPERFNDKNKSSIRPYTYVPFGIGPRGCIGSRFALLEIKIILFHILANFEIKVSEKTKVPLQLAKGMQNIDSADGFWFQLKARA